MILTRLTITNFGVFRDRHEFELRPRVREGHVRPLVLFGGQNGAGKTTILDAIRLCLYGSSFLGNRVRRVDYDHYIRQRLHRSPEAHVITQSASVGLLFEHVHAGVSRTYDAVRSWRLDGSQLNETISIFEDGQPLQEIDPDHWNDFLRDLIPPGVADLFFFDGEQIQSLANDDHESEALESAIRGLLNLDLVERLRGDLSTYLRRQESQNRSQLTEKVVQTDDAFKAFEQEYLARMQDRAQLNTRIEWTHAQIQKKRQELVREGAGFIHQHDTLEQRQRDIEHQLTQTREAIRELAGGLLPFATITPWLQHLRARLQEEAIAEQASIAYEAQQSQAAQVALRLLDPKFQQETSPSLGAQEWSQVASAVQQLLQPVAINKNVITRHPLSAQDRATLLDWIDTATWQVPQQLRTLGRQLDVLESEQTQVEQKLKQIPTGDSSQKAITEFANMVEEKGRLTEQMKQIDEELRQQKLVLDQLNRERDLALKQLAEAGDVNARIERAAKVQVILDQYADQIVELKIQQLEQAIAQYFNLLCRKRLLVREVRIDRNHYTVELYGVNRSHLAKSDLSAGEKQLYAMALLWALRSVSGRALPVIVDTPMGRLDSVHREALLTHFFPHAAHQIIVLSTDTEITPSAYDMLSHAVAHVFALEYDEQAGCTEVRRGYFADQPQEAAA